MLDQKRVLLTGASGFIGFHLAKQLLEDGYIVYGVDIMTKYADEGLKVARLAILNKFPDFMFLERDICDEVVVRNIFRRTQPDIVIHLAGQAGVREGTLNPVASVNANVIGTLNILEACARVVRPEQVLFASSSSVYGKNTDKGPEGYQSEVTPTDAPQGVYAASKIAAEALGRAYSHMYKLPITAMRFFTVYGPFGRPDMAIHTFTAAIKAGEPITVLGDGKQERDFTYISDTVTAIKALMDNPGVKTLFRAVPIGKGKTSTVFELINTLGRIIDRLPIVKLAPAHKDDMRVTRADPSYLYMLTGFKPTIEIEAGLAAYVQWYDEYYSK